MSMGTFLTLLLIVSLFTGLFVEGIKKILDEASKTYKPNILAGTTAAVLSVLTSTGYIVITETAFNWKMAVYLIALLLLSWLASMVGYDKVIQTIKQFSDYK